MLVKTSGILRHAMVLSALVWTTPAWSQSTAPGQQPLWSTAERQVLTWDTSGGLPAAYAPASDIGTSSLAFDVTPEETFLYTCCEKFPHLLRFDANGRNPTLIKLPFPAGKEVDIEALSVCNGVLYLADEDGEDPPDRTPSDCVGKGRSTRQPTIYEYNLRSRVLNSERIRIDPAVGIDLDCLPENYTDSRSLEGLVVFDKWLLPTPQPTATPPYFYLLDEQTMEGPRYYATLCVATLGPDRILRPVAAPRRFPLRNAGERLPELFEHHGALYAIKSFYARGQEAAYSIVQLVADGDGSRGTYVEVCPLTHLMADMRTAGHWTNLEGAAVGPDGALFLTSDNENRKPGTNARQPDGLFRQGTTLMVKLPRTPE